MAEGERERSGEPECDTLELGDDEAEVLRHCVGVALAGAVAEPQREAEGETEVHADVLPERRALAVVLVEADTAGDPEPQADSLGEPLLEVVALLLCEGAPLRLGVADGEMQVEGLRERVGEPLALTQALANEVGETRAGEGDGVSEAEAQRDADALADKVRVAAALALPQLLAVLELPGD